MTAITRTLEQQKEEFKQKKLLASPIAGLIAWSAVAVSGLFFPDKITVWVLFIATGSIVYLAMGISKFTGEDYLDKNKPKNTFDTLFFYTVTQAILVYSIAIPFFIENYTSLPLTVGILTGLMWVPLSWIIDHWVGLFHAITRTISILALWYLFPTHRFVSIPLAIVVIYGVSIFILVKRPTKSESAE
jgi:ethanolamine transporter EutH